MIFILLFLSKFLFSQEINPQFKTISKVYINPGVYILSDAIGYNVSAGVNLYPNTFLGFIPSQFFIGCSFLFGNFIDSYINKSTYRMAGGLELGFIFDIIKGKLSFTLLSGYSTFIVDNNSLARIIINPKISFYYPIIGSLYLGLDLISYELYINPNNWMNDFRHITLNLSISYDFGYLDRKIRILAKTNVVEDVVQQEVVVEKEVVQTNIETNIVYIEKPVVKTVYTRQEIIVEINKSISGMKGVSVSDTNDGIVLNFSDILFDYNKADIKKEMMEKLDLIADMVNKYGILHVLIFGHTDNVGKESFNLDLSDKRAKAVKEYFIKRGIPEDMISAIGYGSSRPIADNKTEEGRAKNRRVEIKFITK